MAPPLVKQITPLLTIYKRRLRQRQRRFFKWYVLLLLLHRRYMRIIAALSLLNVTASVKTITTLKPRIRSCRGLPRNIGWWSNIWENYSDKQFKGTFRISKGTFNFIVEKIRHKLQKKVVIEEPVSPECRLAICLYRLGRGDYPYTIAEMSGLGVSTVRKIVIEVCDAIVCELWEQVSNHFPKTENDFKEKILDMEKL